MLFHAHTTKKLLTLILLFSASVPFVAFGASGTQDLRATKDQMDTLWNTASEKGRRKADLEYALKTFDGKVADAKRNLLQAAVDRRDNTVQIEERQKLIDALRGQLHAAAETRGYYESVAVMQKDDVVAFIRYLAGKQLAERESGPAVGGTLLKTVLRGSLGESIDTALADQALLLSRERFTSQISVLVAEADRAEERILSVLDDLNGEVDGLTERGQHLTETMDASMALIDDSWRQKKLTESQLKNVLQEAGDANAKISEMQTSLTRINAELRESSLVELKAEIEKLAVDRTELSDQQVALERKDQAMSMLAQEVTEAEEAAIQLRNADPKIFKRIEEAELRLKQLEIDEANQSEIDRLREHIALMRTGIPAEVAEKLIRTRHQAIEATEERTIIARELAEITQKISMIDQAIPEKQKELQAAERSLELADVPPIFSWPVRGSITAGYFDDDYRKVFGVAHRAIDISVPQATPIHTASQGIVFAVKDGGATGYSYILVGHRGGYASLYGHVSAAFVKAGDKVSYGQIIGLSGGKPGSHGAGHMTTGAHLHLEMMKNGVHISPTSVLP